MPGRRQRAALVQLLEALSPGELTIPDTVLDAVLQRDRLARLVQYSAHDPKALGLDELLATMKRSIWDVPPERSRQNAATRRAVQRGYVDGLVALAADTAAAADVRAMAELTLGTLRTEAAGRGQASAPAESRAHWRSIASEIAAWERDRKVPAPAALPAPPGDPFGEDEEP